MIRRAFSGFALFLLAGSALAVPITVEYEGTFGSATPLGAVGSTYTLSMTFDDETLPASSFPSFARYPSLFTDVTFTSDNATFTNPNETSVTIEDNRLGQEANGDGISTDRISMLMLFPDQLGYSGLRLNLLMEDIHDRFGNIFPPPSGLDTTDPIGIATADLTQFQRVFVGSERSTSYLGISGLFAGSTFNTAPRVFNDPNVTSIDSIRIVSDDPTQIPEPGTFALFGIGLAGIGLAGRRRRRASH